jgi:hypothetical protein
LVILALLIIGFFQPQVFKIDLRPRCAMLLSVTTREPAVDCKRSKRSPVSAKCPKKLTPNWLSKPSSVLLSGGIITPALLIRTSSFGWDSLNCSENCFTDAKLARSTIPASTCPATPSASMRLMACSILSGFRPAITTCAPAFARAKAA